MDLSLVWCRNLERCLLRCRQNYNHRNESSSHWYDVESWRGACSGVVKITTIGMNGSLTAVSKFLQFTFTLEFLFTLWSAEYLLETRRRVSRSSCPKAGVGRVFLRCRAEEPVSPEDGTWWCGCSSCFASRNGMEALAEGSDRQLFPAVHLHGGTATGKKSFQHLHSSLPRDFATNWRYKYGRTLM
ncbi:hypothetical protein AVEN_30020-1 [Araneus ventricosus]|uniref:Uncharacterized protein n=1 Tax=Araneus ventricosus TaxID=182803 RepID=A0A4Y2DV86_ARAVE|nr:hypothetical protein AVEN_30020-1 [Araneus ventricosus]